MSRRPSLRWRVRRWVLKKLDAWPRERPEPRSEWSELRRAERERLVRENRRLRGVEDRLSRYLDYVEASPDSPWWLLDAAANVRCVVVDEKLDRMLAQFAADGDEVAAEYLPERSA